MRSSVLIIANPAARGSSMRKVEQAAGFLRQRGLDASVIFTTRRGEGESLAKEQAKGYSMVMAAGGDGTINEVMNGLVGSEVPLAVLPLGTTNVLAKELNIPEDVEDAVAVAMTKEARWISLGRIERSPGEVCHFCLMAGIGFDADAVYGVNPAIKRLSGGIAYVLSGIRGVIRYDPCELVMRVDGGEYRGYAAIIGKAGKYGGHFRVTPDAHLADPLLYVCIFRGRRRRDLLRYALGIVRGTHLATGDVVYREARQIAVEGDARIQIDGDYLGRTPARITVSHNAVRLVW